jgi:release factor glutamine methyltransferase
LTRRRWTILNLLNWSKDFFESKGIDDARLTAEMLISFLLGLERISLYTNYDRVLEAEELAKFKELIKRRVSGEPAQYITGEAQFFSLDLKVNKQVMIPRSETELLVEEALKLISPQAIIVDLGTGAGNIALALAKNAPAVRIFATDISKDALQLAEENARIHGPEKQVSFHRGNLFEALAGLSLEGKVDIIVSNPPYVSEREYDKLPPEVREWEPKEALLASEEGLEFHRRIISGAGSFLKPGAWLLLEIGAGQAAKIGEIFARSSIFETPEFVRDYGEIERVAKARRKA